jgi:hypothetical protein
MESGDGRFIHRHSATYRRSRAWPPLHVGAQITFTCCAVGLSHLAYDCTSIHTVVYGFSYTSSMKERGHATAHLER